MSNSRQRPGLARAAALVMAAFAVSRLLGLVRQVVYGAYFGIGPEMDAYVAAKNIPETIFLVVAGGALGSAFIPLFTGRLAKGETASAWRLASAIITILFAVLVPLSLIGIVVAPWLVRVVVAPGLARAVQARTVEVMRVMLLSPTIFGISGIVMGALNAHRHFLLPALAPVVYNLALIAGGIVGGLTPLGAMGPAISMVVGAVGHLLIQVPWLLRRRVPLRPTLGRGDPGVVEVGRLLVPRAFGMAVGQLNVLIAGNLASRLGTSAISALDTAWRVMLLPQGIFAQAVGVAVFPTFSEQAALGETAELRSTLSDALRLLIVLTIPATVGLVLVGQPVVALLFQRGAFNAEATGAVAPALSFYALGLVGLSALEVLGRAFYALHDTWTPVLATVGGVALNAGLGLWLPNVFARAGWPPLGGLALATAVSALVESAVLFVLARRRLGSLDGAAILATTVRVVGASVAMGVALRAFRVIGPEGALVQSLVGVPLGVAVYVALAWILGVDELRVIARVVLKRVG